MGNSPVDALLKYMHFRIKSNLRYFYLFDLFVYFIYHFKNKKEVIMIFSIIILLAGAVLIVIQLVKGEILLRVRGTGINIGWILLILGAVFLFFDLRKAKSKGKKMKK